jgi:hypothetical protein
MSQRDERDGTGTVAAGSWGGQRPSLADYVMGTRPTDRASTAGGR